MVNWLKRLFTRNPKPQGLYTLGRLPKSKHKESKKPMPTPEPIQYPAPEPSRSATQEFQVAACPKCWTRFDNPPYPSQGCGGWGSCPVCGVDWYPDSLKWGANQSVRGRDEFCYCPKCGKRSVEISSDYDGSYFDCRACGYSNCPEDLLHTVLNLLGEVGELERIKGALDEHQN